MLVTLDLPFADVRAGDLSLSLGRPPAPALEVLTADVEGFAVELRLLGCSHQAIVAGAVSETVACEPGLPGRLPERREERTPGGQRYAFRAEVRRLAPAAYAAHAGAAIAAAQDDAHGLVGIFPGPAQAFTALRLAAAQGGVRWRTWHGYPQSGELVITETLLQRAARGAGA